MIFGRGTKITVRREGWNQSADVCTTSIKASLFVYNFQKNKYKMGNPDQYFEPNETRIPYFFLQNGISVGYVQ